MKFSLVCITLALVIAVASARSAKHQEKFAKYKDTHKKSYASKEEEDKALDNFAAVDEDINAHNELFAQGLTFYVKGHNHLSDKSKEERNKLNGARNVNPTHILDGRNHTVAKRDVITTTCYKFNSSCPCFYNFSVDATLTVPASFDVRSIGWNEPVRNQGSCGSCWAFSTSSVMSYYQYSKSKTLIVFSPQNLVDCDGIWGAGGCNGASPAQAMEYLLKNASTIETAYPYKGVQGACTRPSTPLYSITGFFQVSINAPSETALLQAIYKRGAIVVSVHADGLFNYVSGVWDGKYVENGVNKVCDPNAVNHAVVAIGYGVDSATSKKYWLIRNSWGTTWGESGYFRMLRDGTNKCGILSYAYGVF